MYSVAAPVWNRIAQEQQLQTPMARSLFPLSEPKLTEALEARELAMQQQGIEPAVAVAYNATAPLLWENQALQAHARANPDLQAALPDVGSPSEAALLATREYSLTAPQQRALMQLLAKPPT